MGPGLDRIFVQLAPAPPTPSPLLGLLAHTCVGTLPCWEPMWQYPVKIINIQVDITLIIPKLIDRVPWHTKRNLLALMTRYCHIGSQWGRGPTHVRAGQPCSGGDVGRAGPNRMKMWSSPGQAMGVKLILDSSQTQEKHLFMYSGAHSHLCVL
jgi:hypothetical protein